MNNSATTNQARLAKTARAHLIMKLTELLSPKNGSQVPRDKWAAALSGPCKYNPELIEAVCAMERTLRRNDKVEPRSFQVPVRRELLPLILERLPFHFWLLWNPWNQNLRSEEEWPARLSALEDERIIARTTAVAKRLQAALDTGVLEVTI